MTKQEDLWRGEFGDEYTKRNDLDEQVPANIMLFAKALRRCYGIETILEIGAGAGRNLEALEQLYPGAALHAMEINRWALSELHASTSIGHVYEQSILETFCRPVTNYDLVLTKGLLIHIHPEKDLKRALKNIGLASSRYVLFCEYYSPTHEAIPYRGQEEALWKGDFVTLFRFDHPWFRLIDYGFVYHGDPVAPQDDLTWFLLERTP